MLAQQTAAPTIWDAIGYLLNALSWGGSAIGLILIFFLGWVLGHFIQALLSHWVRHRKDRELEDFKAGVKIREQAARAAELLALAYSNGDAQAERFNKLAWELSLYLPAATVCDLSRCMAERDPNKRKDAKEVLIDIRKYLLRNHPNYRKLEQPPLKPGNIPHAQPGSTT